MRHFPFPKSFPDKKEELFVRLLLSSDQDFLSLWDEWKAAVIFDDIEQPVLRLLPVLYLRLRSFDRDDELTGRIKGVYKLAWVKNQQLLAAVAKVSATLERSGIKVMILKGIPLLLEIYKDTGARFLGDADMLIHPRHTRKAIELMFADGWRSHSSQFPGLDRFSDESLPRIVKELTFINDQRIEVDLHWRVFETLENVMRFDDLYRDGLSVDHKGATYRMPSVEDLLVHVIVHGAAGSPIKTLRWTVDAATIIRTHDVNWDSLLGKTELYRFGIELRVGLSYLAERGFAGVPEHVIESLHALPFTDRQVRAYYEKANTVHSPWGGLPRLWRTYWQYESSDKSPKSTYNFFGYLAGAWGLSRRRDLIPFVWGKYKRRLSYYIDQVKKKYAE